MAGTINAAVEIVTWFCPCIAALAISAFWIRTYSCPRGAPTALFTDATTDLARFAAHARVVVWAHARTVLTLQSRCTAKWCDAVCSGWIGCRVRGTRVARLSKCREPASRAVFAVLVITVRATTSSAAAASCSLRYVKYHRLSARNAFRAVC